jgi:YD repeat-containing protein
VNYVYGYDAIGNRLKSSSASLRLASAKFDYNSLNQMTNPGYKYDTYGNLIKTPDAEYSYDLHDRLVEVKKSDVTVKYSYDPLGQRISSEEILATKGTKITKFLMSGMVEQARIEFRQDNRIDKIQFHTIGLDLAASLTATGCVGGVLASTSR